MNENKKWCITEHQSSLRVTLMGRNGSIKSDLGKKVTNPLVEISIESLKKFERNEFKQDLIDLKKPN